MENEPRNFNLMLISERENYRAHILSAHPVLDHPAGGVPQATCHKCLNYQQAIANLENLINRGTKPSG